MVKFREKIVTAGQKIVAILSFSAAKSSANSACLIPLFEPKQPEDIAKLKK